MGLFDLFRKKEEVKKSSAFSDEVKKEIKNAKSLRKIADSELKEFNNRLANSELVTQNSTLNGCKNIITRVYSEPRFVVHDLKTNERLEQHPFQKLLDNPTNEMGGATLRSFQILSAMNFGNCFLHIRRTGESDTQPDKCLPLELVPYTPLQIKPVMGKYNYIKHYQIIDSKEEIRKEDIIHLTWSTLSNSNPLIGTSPLRQCFNSLQLYQSLDSFNNLVLKSAFLPFSIISYPAGVTVEEDEVRQIKDKYLSMLDGVQSDRVLVLNEGAEISTPAKLTEVGVSISLQDRLDLDICKAFGVPPSLAGIKIGVERSTYNNYRSASKDFIEKTIQVLWSLHADQISRKLSLYDPSVYVSYAKEEVSSLVPTEEETRSQMIQLFQSGVVTIDEIRSEFGLEASAEINNQNEVVNE